MHSKALLSAVSILARLWGRALLDQHRLLSIFLFVSILARLWGRALPGKQICCTVTHRFQSSPGFGAGRYRPKIEIKSRYFSFNPRPALGPGATICRPNYSSTTRCFNPRPALGPGATVQLQLDHTSKKFYVTARTGD